MAGEIRLQATTGLTVKALIVGDDGTVWNGTAMVAVSTLTDANWTASLIACTEQETSEGTGTGLYVADWPGTLTQSAIYSVVFFSGAAPSPGDIYLGVQNDPTNAQVVNALNVDTYSEPGQEAPAAALSLIAKIGYLFKAWRNNSLQTADQYSLLNDDDVTVDQKAAISSDGTTTSKGKITTGP